MSLPLDGHVVLVAGASSGIGRATAIAAAAAGAGVALLARRRDRLDEVSTSIEGSGRKALSVPADATDENAVRTAVENAERHFGRIDVLVNSVGLNVPDRALTALSPERWRQLLRVNLDSAYHLTQAVLPVFRRQARGLLLHISSSGAKRADASGAGYQAAKAGVAALAHATMHEERGNGVRVSVIYPGMTSTPLVYQRPTAPTEDELSRALQPDDVANMCLAVMMLPGHAYVPELQILPSKS